MSDARRQAIRAWLEFARELGVDALPAPPPPVAVATPTGAAVPAGALDQLRRSLLGAQGPAGPPEGAAPGAGAALATMPEPTSPPASVSGRRPLERLLEVPAELLVIPGDLFTETAGAAPASTLEGIRETIGDCQRCKLCKGRTHIVFGSGNPAAELMFVGEGPGRDEDLSGLPFVGRAGQLLTDIIKAIQRTREEVYIANVVKCRPPDNRTPAPDEVAACRGFLFRQLQAIRPKVVVALGRPATETLLGRPVSISEVRGQEFDLFGARLIPTFHPAYLLRSPNKKRETWEDMKKVRDLLAIRP